MKFSMCMAVMVSLALATTGCRYNKGAGDDVPGPEDGEFIAGGAEPLAVDTETDAYQTVTVDEGAYDPAADQGPDSGSLADLSGKSFAERGYRHCPDAAFAPVYFGFDATSIRPEELAKVEAVARHLAANPNRVVTIEGNCDERGSNEYNLSLGDDRAIIIGNFLAQNGIARDRIETVSRGESNPAVVGSGESAWSQNRRGEFIIWER